MTEEERAIAEALSRCTFLPGCWDKRFARDMAAHAARKPDEPISERQAAHLLRLSHKYRRQLPTRIIEMALDEMEKRANARRAAGLPALPDFTPARLLKRRVREIQQ